jgi:hypothetical protein
MPQRFRWIWIVLDEGCVEKFPDFENSQQVGCYYWNGLVGEFHRGIFEEKKHAPILTFFPGLRQ